MKTEKHFNWLVTMIGDKVNFYPIFQRQSRDFHTVVVTYEICSLIWRDFITKNKSPAKSASLDRLNA